MSQPPDDAMIAAVLDGDEAAWAAFIGHYERRLAGFFRPRTNGRAVDDLVQETFLAFWRAAPNFERGRPVEPLLFAIAANKLTDRLRREGRRPSLPLSSSTGGSSAAEPESPGRAVSSMARSRERRLDEEEVLAGALASLIAKWRRNGAWDRLAVLELTLVAERGNRDAADRLGLDEQTVANHKSYALKKVREEVGRRGVTGKVFAGDAD